MLALFFVFRDKPEVAGQTEKNRQSREDQLRLVKSQMPLL